MTTNFSKSREEMQLEDFCHALNRENNIIQDQLTEYKVKHEVACSTINLLQKKCDIRGKALSLQCKETKELRQQLDEARGLLGSSSEWIRFGSTQERSLYAKIQAFLKP